MNTDECTIAQAHGIKNLVLCNAYSFPFLVIVSLTFKVD
jgi:hypothetical protein